MNSVILTALLLITITLTGCSGRNGAGHWFHILFVIIPLGFILYLLNQKVNELSKSLFKIEGKLSQLASKLDKSDKNQKK